MTEHEWDACTSPAALLNYLVRAVSDRGRTSRLTSAALERKLRLFLCACGRRLWPVLPDARSRQAVEVAERVADSRAGRDELRPARTGALAAADAARAVWVQTRQQQALLSWRAAHLAVAATDETLGRSVYSDWVVEHVEQVALLHEIVGYPFADSNAEPAWYDGAVRQTAASIAARRRYDELPALATALERAGCTDARLLAHCRRAGGHVHGCWAIDQVLGRV